MGLLKHSQPINGHPFGRTGFPQAKADTHGPGEQQDDIPGHHFQVIDIQDSGYEKQDRGEQNDGCFMGGHKPGNRGLHDGKGTQGNDHQADDAGSDDLFAGDAAQFGVKPFGFFLEAGDGLLFRFHHDYEKAPQDKGHDPADRKHVPGQFKKADILARDILEKPQGDSPTGGAQQGDDGTGPGHVGHADKQAFAELGLFVTFTI